MQTDFRRLEAVRYIAEETLRNMNDTEEKRCACRHLYGVAQSAALLALKRGLDPELAAVSGMLHDLYGYHTGISFLHGENGAEMARPLLRDMGLFTENERFTVLSAVFHHSDKSRRHGGYDELLKDADTLQHYLYNTAMPVRAEEAERLKSILSECSLPGTFPVAPGKETPCGNSPAADRRMMLAQIAESLASKNICGMPADREYLDICRYFPDRESWQALKGGWCAAFVYHCCVKAGFVLPIRYPGGVCRFAGVAAWPEWAKLSQNNFFHPAEELAFTPQRGDIVIYDRLLTDGPHDHTGVVLSADENTLSVAEGNADNQNVSAVVARARNEKIGGYIRIDNRYHYDYHGDFVLRKP